MSGLIDRDAALAAIEARAYELESSDSLNTAYGCRLAGDAIRTLPCIGTCATCAEWQEEFMAEVRHQCHSAVYARDYCDPPETPPDHYCAAWRARA